LFFCKPNPQHHFSHVVHVEPVVFLFVFPISLFFYFPNFTVLTEDWRLATDNFVSTKFELISTRNIKSRCLDRKLLTIYYLNMIIIKSDREIKGIKEASRILAATFGYINGIIEEGMETKYLDKKIEEFIVKRNAVPAFKGYRGYPASSCISVNEVVIHGIPDGRKIKEGDLVGIDIGVKYRVFYSDAAYTFGIGNLKEESKKLMNVTKAALFNAIPEMKTGKRVGDISHAIQQTAENAGFSVVRDFVGHGVGKKLHEDPAVPNFGKKGVGHRLKSGMTIAIEPMINAGTYEVETLKDGWTVVTKDRKLSAHFEHTILITKKNPQILTNSSLYNEKF
jgi:methionyl aminopeptidase